ncbi:MAG: right-handed parallel beta-helix repeat-containing protein [Anaerolineae bacterium]|nr:right-handed parallel beta-helix repeat-containing protein [Anaerolineae bacterium]
MKRKFTLWLLAISGAVLGLSILWLALSAPTAAGGPTYVYGSITTDTVWLRANSPYIVISTVKVENSAVLTIEAGVEVKFQSGQGLEVMPGSRLIAVGTRTEPITFTTALANPVRKAWSGIRWFSSHNRLENVLIEWAHYGLLFEPGSRDNTVVGVTFRNIGDYADPGSEGAAVFGTVDNSSIRHCVVQNVEHGFYLIKSFNNYLSDNIIDGSDGIGIALKGEAAIASGNRIINNLINNCGGEGLYLSMQGNATLAGNEVRYSAYRSSVTGASIAGISVQQLVTRPVRGGVAIEGSQNITLQANRIHHNGAEAGLYISNTTGVTISNNFIYLNSREGLRLLGSSAILAYNNAFYGNGGFEWADVGSLAPNAVGNWWGTNSPQWGVEITGTANYTPWVTFAFTATPRFLPADGLSKAALQIALVDGMGHHAPDGFPVYLAASLGNLSTFEVTTTAGLGLAYLQAPLLPGVSYITATAPMTMILYDWVSFVPMAAYTLDLTAYPSTVPADGTTPSTLVACVRDPSGRPAPDGTVVVFTTTLGSFPGGLSSTPIPAGVMPVEAETGVVTKTGTWLAYSDPSASGGGGVRSNIAGSKLTWTYTGTAFSILFQKQPDGGIAHVYLDGYLYASVDTYNPITLYQQEITVATGLPWKMHNLEVMVTGQKNPSSSGYQVTVDAFRAYGVGRNNAYLTSGGCATTTLTSAVSGTASLLACAERACDTALVNFTGRRYFVYLPLILKGLAVPVCQELVVNGGFETQAGWIIGATPRPARYVTSNVRSGSYSILLGVLPTETDVHAYSSIRQLITLPANTTITLTYWYYPISQGDLGDKQQALLLNKDGGLLKVLWEGNENDPAWKRRTFSLTDYAGQSVYLYFNVFNDGDGLGRAAMYLDDVSVEACSIAAPPPTPTPCPTPTPPPPYGCYPYIMAARFTGDAPHGVAINKNAGEIYVVNNQAGTMTVFSETTYSVITTVHGLNHPNGVAYNPANNHIYVANSGSDSVSVFDASTRRLIKTIPVGDSPNGVAVDPVLNRIYVANYGSDTVSIIDGSLDIVTRTVAVGDEPAMIAVNPVTHKAYVALHGAGHIAVIYPDMRVKDVDIYSAGPYGIAVDPVRNLVYVVTIDTYRIVAVDGNEDKFLGWAEVRRERDGTPAPLRQIAVNPYIGTSGHIYVTTTGTDGPFDKVLMLPKGWPEYFARPYALDMGSGSDPREGIAFDQNRSLVYVTLRGKDELTVIQDGEPACFQNFSIGQGRLTFGEFFLKICVFEGGRCKWITK